MEFGSQRNPGERVTPETLINVYRPRGVVMWGDMSSMRGALSSVLYGSQLKGITPNIVETNY